MWSHTFNRVTTPNPVLLPAKSSSGLLNHYHNSCASRWFPHQSSAANNARQTKGRRCVYLCPAHGWAVQMQIFIYNPPNFPVIAFWSSHRRKRLIQLLRRDDSVFSWSTRVLKTTGWARVRLRADRWTEREGGGGRTRMRRERMEGEVMCDSLTPNTTNRGRATSAHQAGQRPNTSTAGTV